MREIEVEAKYPLSGTADDWRRRLEDLGAVVLDSIRQCDEYFAHPARDFVATGEAFRIRNIGDQNALTYKGPLLDSTTKSREEIEIGFASGSNESQRLRTMLMALGFRPSGAVHKRRTQFEMTWSGRNFGLALDEVDDLGLFLEIERLVAEQDWTAARDELLALAANLGLGASERRSYLELLLRLS